MTHPSSPAPKHHDHIAAAYDSQPWWYDLRGFLILTFAYRSTLWEQVRFFASNLRKDHLEVAIGTGTLFNLVLKWRALAKAAPVKTVGFDYAEPMLAGAIRRFRDRADVRLDHADVCSLPYEDASFDSVNVANAMHCFPRVEAALAEMHRVLRPGGTIAMNALLHPRGGWPAREIATRINAWGVRREILHSPYAADDLLARVAAAGFAVTRAEIQGNTCNLLAQKAA